MQLQMKIPRQDKYTLPTLEIYPWTEKSQFKGFCFQAELVISLASPEGVRCSPCWAPKSFVCPSIIGNFFKSTYLLNTYYMPDTVHTYRFLFNPPNNTKKYILLLSRLQMRLREIKNLPKVT